MEDNKPSIVLNIKGGAASDNIHTDKHKRFSTHTADILEFSDSEESKWTKVGKMFESRHDHAVSIVDFEDFKHYCH